MNISLLLWLYSFCNLKSTKLAVSSFSPSAPFARRSSSHKEVLGPTFNNFLFDFKLCSKQNYRFKSVRKRTIYNEDNNPIFTRDARLSDLGTVADIITEGFNHNKTNFFTYKTERFKTLSSLKSHFPDTDSINDVQHVMLIAEEQQRGKIVGFAELDISSNTAIITNSLRPQAYMCNLTVEHRWRRRGIAKLLISACENKAICYGREKMFLMVMEGNIPALELYQSMGYSVESASVITLQQNKEPVAVLLLKKNLSGPAQDNDRCDARE